MIQHPAGQQAVTFPVGTVENNITDGDQVASLTVSAGGFVSATQSVTVLDADIPDLVLTSANVFAPLTAVTGQQVPATGISIGVSRLLSAVKQRSEAALPPLVVVLAMDDVGRSFVMASELREAGIRAEAYVGTRKFGDQLKYADKRGAAIAVIEGAD